MLKMIDNKGNNVIPIMNTTRKTMRSSTQHLKMHWVIKKDTVEDQ